MIGSPLKNVVEMAEQNLSFDLPGIEELKNLKVGDFVKVISSPERFWVQIDGTTENGYVGKIDSHLVCTEHHGHQYGDVIFVQPENICQIDHPRD